MSQLICKGVQKLLGEWFFEAALLPNQNVLPCVRYVSGSLSCGCQQITYVTEKTYVYFLFKYSLVRRRWGVQSIYISSRTNKLMTGKFVLCLSDNCCFYERLGPGGSKTYVTFDIAEESCTWSLTASNVCDYWHFQSLVESKCIARILTLIIIWTVT